MYSYYVYLALDTCASDKIHQRVLLCSLVQHLDNTDQSFRPSGLYSAIAKRYCPHF